MTATQQAKSPHIYVCQPSYASGIPTSHKMFWTGCLRPQSEWNGRLRLVMAGGSLLANCFNQFWVDALNRQDSGEDIRYFAMLHDDIVPEQGWLDVLVEELVKTEADLLSAVVPIKDALGLSSTAIDDPNDLFNVERRITMSEIYKLPETFSAADCGYTDRMLLANTGCWVCDFTKDWRKAFLEQEKSHLRFTIRDRIVYLPDRPVGKRWKADVAPEDWNFSRDVQSLGAKVLVTRKVKLDHMGSFSYPNREPWGVWGHDKVFAHKFGSKPIGGNVGDTPSHLAVGIDPGYESKIYADVDGWLTDNEGQALRAYASGKRVLEIGSYCGRSTVWMSQTAESLCAVDTFDGRGTPEPRDCEREFLANVARHGTPDVVSHRVGTSELVLPKLREEGVEFDLIFIDGSHQFDDVCADIRLSLPLLSENGFLCFHDYQRPCDPGVTQAVDLMVSHGSQIMAKVDTLALVRPSANLTAAVKKAS